MVKYYVRLAVYAAIKLRQYEVAPQCTLDLGKGVDSHHIRVFNLFRNK